MPGIPSLLRARRQPEVHDQEGSIALIVASVLAITGALLISIQMGYNYFEERRLQKAADLAALSAAQFIKTKTCNRTELEQLARDIAVKNGLKAEVITSVDCGRWAGVPEPVFKYPWTGTDEKPLNAVRVHAATTTMSFLPQLFGFGARPSNGHGAVGGIRVQVGATAAVGLPMATFSVGARLLSLDNGGSPFSDSPCGSPPPPSARPAGLVPVLLKSMGLNPDDIRVLDSCGLASVSTTPAGLLRALGLPASVLADVGTPEQLAKVRNLSLGQLLTAYADVLDQSTTTDVEASAIRSVFANINADSLAAPVRLFGQDGVMLNATTTELPSALNARLKLLDLIGASVIAANGTRLVDLDASAVPGLLSLNAQVVSPPTLATTRVGGPAVDNTQIQLRLDLAPLPIPPVSEPTPITLPLTVGVANSQGKLTGISFDEGTASFRVKSSTVNLCIGKLSGNGACTEDSTPDFADFVTVNLLLLSVTVQVRAKILLVAGADWSSSFQVPVGKTRKILANTSEPRTSIAQSDLQTNLKASVLGIPFSLPLGSILSPLITGINGLLTPLFQNVLIPLLGGELNSTDIRLYAITRGAPYLVK